MQKFAIPEVSNPLGSGVSRWTKNTQKPKLFETQKKSSKTQKLKNVQKYAKISDTPLNQRSLNPSGSVVSTLFCKAKSAKKMFYFVRQFQTISKQKGLNLRPLLSITFPQGFPISKNIGQPTSGSGGKKTFKRYLKSEHTHGQTDRQTDISPYRKHRPKGPML